MRLRPIACAALAAIVLLASDRACAQSTHQLAGAHQLLIEGKYEEAIAIYADLEKSDPKNGEVWFGDGYAHYLEATATANPTAARALFQQSFALLNQAKAVGSTNVMLSGLLAEIDGAGNRQTGQYSSDPKAQALILQGEQAYGQRRLDDAISDYNQALKLDPHSYYAALFAGDAVFSKKDFSDSIDWFAKAVEIDPNKETAHRYWGDALLHSSDFQGAQNQYIESVIAEPYSKYARTNIEAFAKRRGTPVHHPVINLPRQGFEKKGNAVINYNPKDGPLVLAYLMARVKWQQVDWKSFYPAGTEVRHSLPEECSALRSFIKTASQMAESKPESVTPLVDTIATLKDLDEDRLLECYVLLDRADAGISQDYVAYRQTHRVELERYLHEVWFPAKK